MAFIDEDQDSVKIENRARIRHARPQTLTTTRGAIAPSSTTVLRAAVRSPAARNCTRANKLRGVPTAVSSPSLKLAAGASSSAAKDFGDLQAVCSRSIDRCG